MSSIKLNYLTDGVDLTVKLEKISGDNPVPETYDLAYASGEYTVSTGTLVGRYRTIFVETDEPTIIRYTGYIDLKTGKESEVRDNEWMLDLADGQDIKEIIGWSKWAARAAQTI